MEQLQGRNGGEGVGIGSRFNCEGVCGVKLFICGYARHGKDFAAETLRGLYGLKFESSSHFAMRQCVRRELANKYDLTYDSYEDCFKDRVNHRSKWFDIIRDYNKEDPARLARELFAENDIYVGMRSCAELDACVDEGLTDLIIWVDAVDRIDTIESTHSMDITASDADFIITNNGTRGEFIRKLARIFDKLQINA